MIDWRAIASAQADGDAPERDIARLQSWLAESPANADEYLLWVEMHDALRDEYREDTIRRSAGVETILPYVPRHGRAIARRPILALVTCGVSVAATLLLSLWGAGLLRTPGAPALARQDPAANGAAEIAEADRGDIAATLTGAVDCVWREGFEPIRYGEHLFPGTVLRLAEGMVQVTYESGAKLVLRGPTEYHVEGPAKGILNVGQLTAVVPRRAAGFIVQTPYAEVIDLGTEFAVDVDESGVSEVHVFKGEVVSRHRDAALPAAKDLHLYTDEAARYGPAGRDREALKADQTRFIREITPRLTSSELPRAPQVDGLALWLAADLLVKTDDQNRVVAWRDVLCGDNQAPDDAIQVKEEHRPLFVPGGMNGADTIRFDGAASHLVTTPMETGDSQTILMVTRIDSTDKRYHTGSLLNYNGPPHRDLDASSLRGEPGVLQIGLGPQKDGATTFESFVYVGDSARSGEVVSRPVAIGRLGVIAYVYNIKKNRAALYVNGELHGETSAPAPAAVTSRRVIGRHGHHASYFRGDISEVLIFNGALGPRKLEAVTGYLSEKYAINAGG